MLHQVGDERDGLDGFTEAHLISQDPVQVVIVERNHPFQTLDLENAKAKRGGRHLSKKNNNLDIQLDTNWTHCDRLQPEPLKESFGSVSH